MNKERWFEIESPKPGIRSIVVGKDALGFKIDIHGTNADDRFEGSDTIQDRISSVVRILRRYVGSDSGWVDYDTREQVHVWDAIVALSELEGW